MDPIRVMTTTTEPTSTESISADELAYHKKAVYELRVAQGVWASWSGHLIQKYQIGPTDQLDENGVIRRGATAPLVG